MNHSEAENHMLSVPALDMYYGGHMDSNASQAAMAATERRLYALPIIRERIEDNREELTELENCGVEGSGTTPPRWCASYAPACV
ncbi:MAG: hypothetical protein MR745_04585 [Clostridiales bacterium]|nr:hypothetical protein [Clostridiales bacterium]